MTQIWVPQFPPHVHTPRGKPGLCSYLSLKSSHFRGTSLAVQWLALRASNAGGAGLIPGRGTRIPHVARGSKKKKKKKIPHFNVHISYAKSMACF